MGEPPQAVPWRCPGDAQRLQSIGVTVLRAKRGLSNVLRAHAPALFDVVRCLVCRRGTLPRTALFPAPRRYVGHKQGRFVIRSAFGGDDDAFVLSGSEDSQIYIWHRQDGQLLKVRAGSSCSVSATHRSPVIARATPLRGVFLLYSCSAQVLPGHSRSVNSVSWSPVHPHMFASASDDHTIWIWGPPQEQTKGNGIL